MAYDITEAFEDIELALIKSMRANMKRHINPPESCSSMVRRALGDCLR